MVSPAHRALNGFSPATRGWFTGAFDAPTTAQAGAWQAIAEGSDVLVVAPTGSGKTLAAFLAALDQLASTPPPADPKKRCRVLYVSPSRRSPSTWSATSAAPSPASARNRSASASPSPRSRWASAPATPPQPSAEPSPPVPRTS